MRIAFVMADKVVIIQRVEGDDRTAPVFPYVEEGIAYSQSTNASCGKSTVFAVERTILLEIVEIGIIICHPKGWLQPPFTPMVHLGGSWAVASIIIQHKRMRGIVLRYVVFIMNDVYGFLMLVFDVFESGI